MQYEIKQGMNQDILKQFPDNHFDSIVTDPPYGIEFLGKDWDSNTGTVETWQECLRVLKPGGYLLAFSAARTYHHLATNIESVGFEIRDQLMWIYASGFPKAQDIGKAIDKRNGMSVNKLTFSVDELTKVEDFIYKHNKTNKIYRRLPNINGDKYQKSLEGNSYKNDLYEEVYEKNNKWSGWKTALKPAHEPIVMARKPFKGSTIDNVLTHGTGALNIDATRIGDRFPSNVMGDIPDYQKYFYCPKVSRKERHTGFEQKNVFTVGDTSPETIRNHPLWDPSIGTNPHRFKQKLLDHAAKSDPLGHIPTSKGGFLGTDGDWSPEHWHGNSGQKSNNYTQDGTLGRMKDAMHKNDILTGNDMIQQMNATKSDDGQTISIPGYGDIKVHGLKHQYEIWCKDNNQTAGNVGNNHPTVKPVELMKYLVRLVTPPNSKVLDPFCGSGSTGMAAVELGHTFVGCELDPAYVEIANKRIHSWNDHGLGPLFE